MSSASRSESPSNTKATKVVDISGGKKLFNNGWTKEQEELMAGWADIATSYRWMHDKCDKKMSKSNMWITVPVIILSTLTGSANFMLQSVIPPSDTTAQKLAQIAIGSVSIFTGILTTLGNFFRYAQNSESNRVASISWGKLQRHIAIELALHPMKRIDSLNFLNICRAELDRLIEQSPPIPDDIIMMFEKEFEDIQDFKRPDIAHGIDHTKVFDSKDARLTHLAVEAVTMLKQRRRVWHDAMMPEVDKRVNKAVTDLSGSILSAMQDRVKVLEDVVTKQTKEKELNESTIANHATSFIRSNNSPPIPRGRAQTPKRSSTDTPVGLENITLNNTVPDQISLSPSELIKVLSNPPRTENPLMTPSQIDIVINRPGTSRDSSPERTGDDSVYAKL